MAVIDRSKFKVHEKGVFAAGKAPRLDIAGVRLIVREKHRSSDVLTFGKRALVIAHEVLKSGWVSFSTSTEATRLLLIEYAMPHAKNAYPFVKVRRGTPQHRSVLMPRAIIKKLDLKPGKYDLEFMVDGSAMVVIIR